MNSGLPLAQMRMRKLHHGDYGCGESQTDAGRRQIFSIQLDSTGLSPLSKQVMTMLANSCKSSPQMLDHLAGTWCESVCQAVAANENASPETLFLLSEHPSPEVRAALVDNRNLPLLVLISLCRDECVDVRFAVAEHPYVPRLLLTKLAQDDNPYVSFRASKTLQRLESQGCGRNGN